MRPTRRVLNPRTPGRARRSNPVYLLQSDYTIDTLECRGKRWREVVEIGPPYNFTFSSPLLPLRLPGRTTRLNTQHASFECRGVGGEGTSVVTESGPSTGHSAGEHQVSRAAIQPRRARRSVLASRWRRPLPCPWVLVRSEPARCDSVLLSGHAIARRRTGVKAVVYDRYGGPDELRVVDPPTVPRGRSGAAEGGRNVGQSQRLGVPARFARVCTDRRTALSDGPHTWLGHRRCGRRRRRGVVELRVGDHVYGDSLVMKGGFAEYAVVPQAALARKPAELTFAESSTIPQSGAIALQGSAGVMPGARVLINGAGGGSGTFAIQLAKRLGAHVTAVDNAAKQDFMTLVGPMRSSTSAGPTSPGQPRPTTSSWTWSPTAQCSLTGVHCRRAERIGVWAGRRVQCCGSSVGLVAGRLTARSIGVLAVKEGPRHAPGSRTATSHDQSRHDVQTKSTGAKHSTQSCNMLDY